MHTTHSQDVFPDIKVLTELSHRPNVKFVRFVAALPEDAEKSINFRLEDANSLRASLHHMEREGELRDRHADRQTDRQAGRQAEKERRREKERSNTQHHKTPHQPRLLCPFTSPIKNITLAFS